MSMDGEILDEKTGTPCNFHTTIRIDDNMKRSKIHVSSWRSKEDYIAKKPPIRSRVDGVETDIKNPTPEEMYVIIKKSKMSEWADGMVDSEGEVILKDDFQPEELNPYANSNEV